MQSILSGTSRTSSTAIGYSISKESRMKLLLWRPWNNIAAKRGTFITYKSRKRRAHLTPDLKRDLKTVPERGNYSDSEKKTNINTAHGSQGKTGGRGSTLNWQVRTCLWMQGGRRTKPTAGLGYPHWKAYFKQTRA